MSVKIFKNTSEIIMYYLNFFSNIDIIGIDMTVGNGHDIYNIAKIVGSNSILYGFDINPIAIENTNKKLKKIDNIEINIIEDSHDNILKFVNEEIDLVIYNLGYLPLGDKSITTNFATVIKSINIVMGKLKTNGIILITFYPGHKNGMLESVYIEQFLSRINQKNFNILRYNFINQINDPPYVIVIERLK